MSSNNDPLRRSGLILPVETSNLLKALETSSLEARFDDHIGFLVEGESGAGKTTLLEALDGSQAATSGVLDVALLRPLSAGEGAKEIVDFLEPKSEIESEEKQLFLIDNLDAISEAESGQSILLSAFMHGLEKLSQGKCLVIATCMNRKSVPPDLLALSLLGETIVLPYPAQLEREVIFNNLLSDLNITIITTPNHDEAEVGDISSLVVSMARTTQGCSYGDLLYIIRSEVFKSETDRESERHRRPAEEGEEGGSVVLRSKSLLLAAMEFSPSHSGGRWQSSSGNGGAGLLLSSSYPPTQTRQLVAVQQVQNRLMQAVSTSATNGYGNKPCSGILLHGPTGCGKSALVEWLAYQVRGTHKLIVLPCADLVHKVVGESESRLAAYFSQARALAPCLLILDSIDIVFGSTGDVDVGGGGQSGAGPGPGRGVFQPRSSRSKHAALDRLLSTLLVELDGITSGNDINVTGSPAPSRGDVVVVATASEKSLLDKALKRPGRLEEHIELSLPSREDRLCYFEQEISSRSPHTGHDCEEGDEDGGGGQGVDAGLLAALADRTAGYSYARLNLIVQEASHSALRARLGSSSVENRVGSNCTTTRDEAREAFFEFLRKKM